MEIFEASLLFFVVLFFNISMRRVPAHSHEGMVASTEIWSQPIRYKEKNIPAIYLVSLYEKNGTTQIMVTRGEFLNAFNAELRKESYKIVCAQKFFFGNHRSIQLMNQ